MSTKTNFQKTLNYKGYEGYVTYNGYDNVYYGWILDINGLVDFIAEDEEDIQKEFESAVDDYIQFLADMKREYKIEVTTSDD